MSKFIKLFLAVFLLASCSKKSEESNLTIVTEKGNVTYVVENVQEVSDLEKGLMFREKLDPEAGMMFDLSKVEKIAMWMKNTKIPLDILFIDKEGVISWIYENAEPESTTLILPPFPAVAVLELNAGDVKKRNIKIGDTVKHEFLNNNNDNAVVNQNSDEITPTASEAIDELKAQPSEETNVVSETEDNLTGDEPVPASDEPKPEVLTE